MFFKRNIHCIAIIGLVFFAAGSVFIFPAAQRQSAVRNEGPEKILRRIQPAGESWRIPEPLESDDHWSRLGKSGRPLIVRDAAGRSIGEIYQVRSHQTYRGLLMISRGSGRFYELSWPIERVMKELRRYDLNNPLEEVDQFLVIDEDQLILRVNRGKRELDVPVMSFDVNEWERTH